MKKLAFAAAALFAATSAPAVAAPVLVNGSFEQTGQQYSPALGGLYEASGWVNTSQLQIQASSALSGVEGTPAATGARFLRLVSDSPDPLNTGSIYQNLGTMDAGRLYTITGTAFGGDSVNNAWGGLFSLSSAADGGQIFAATSVLGLTRGQSANFSFSFTSTAANAGQSLFLRLAATPSLFGQDTRGGVDNVQLATAAVPEPATWAMMLVGFAMAGVGLRARRKQSVRITYA